MAEEPTGAQDAAREPTFAEAFSAALGKAGFATVKPGEMPSGSDLVAAVGGIRGLVESILPGLAFLIVFAVTSQVLKLPQSTILVASVGTLVVISVLFLAARLIARQPIRSAIMGIILAAIMAAFALLSGKPENAFVPGIIINVVCLVVVLASLVVRWPLIGVFVGALTSDLTGWRADKAKRRVLTLATWMWVGLFAIRLVVEIPLYYAGYTDWLAVAKIFLGVPFYAVLLWVTWLFVGTVFATPVAEGKAAKPAL
jgi:hypothetical protein